MKSLLRTSLLILVAFFALRARAQGTVVDSDEPSSSTVNPQLATESEEPEEDVEPVRPTFRQMFHPFVGIGFDSGSVVNFYAVTASDSSGSGTGNVAFQVKPAFSVDAGFYLMSPETHYGCEAAIIVEQKRAINSVTTSITSASTSTIYGSSSTLQFIILEGNFVIEALHGIYFPLGFNIAVPSIRGVSDSYSYNVGIGTGLQVGVGISLFEHLHLEAQLRAITLSLKETNADASVDYGPGVLAGAELRARYAF